MRLDNAAKIYPVAGPGAVTPVFRLSVTLKDRIRYRELNDALRRIVERTPYYQVYIRRGVFWYYLERHQDYPTLEVLPDTPITSISLHSRREQLIRVLIRDFTIAVDVSHVLTDGYGGMVFLGSLLVEYLRRLGHTVEPEPPLLDPDEPPDPEEYDDAYQRMYSRGVRPAVTLAPAYHVPGLAHVNRYRLIVGRMPLAAVLAKARERGATLTEYIVATKIAAIKDVHDEQLGRVITPQHSIIRIEVPVNMRKVYPTRSMRNFSLFVGPELDLSLGDYSFDQIVRRVHHDMQIQLDRNQLLRQISRNVGGERNRLVRVIPRPVKDAYMRHLRRTIGDRSYSGVVSNLGRFVVPKAAEEQIERIGFVLGPNSAYKVGMSVVSLADELIVTIGSVVADRTVERNVIRRLAADGVPVIVTEA